MIARKLVLMCMLLMGLTSGFANQSRAGVEGGIDFYIKYFNQFSGYLDDPNSVPWKTLNWTPTPDAKAGLDLANFLTFNNTPRANLNAAQLAEEAQMKAGFKEAVTVLKALKGVDPKDKTRIDGSLQSVLVIVQKMAAGVVPARKPEAKRILGIWFDKMRSSLQQSLKKDEQSLQAFDEWMNAKIAESAGVIRQQIRMIDPEAKGGEGVDAAT